MMDRDLKLAGVADRVFDTVLGLAFSMNTFFADRHPVKRPNAAALEHAREIQQRYVSLVFAVAPSLIEYRENMSEEELRKWANALVSTLR